MSIAVFLSKMKKKKILLLGSTGTIGEKVVSVIKKYPHFFELVGASAHQNDKKLQQISDDLGVKNTVLTQNLSPEDLTIFLNQEYDIAINAISGEGGIFATEHLVKKTKPLCLANKESLVMRGKTIMQTKKNQIFLIDSEHSSFEHLLSVTDKNSIEKLWLTASGGPFRDEEKYPKDSFKTLTVDQALNHPNWSMGKKITIDSATLMNKAFEFIEAVYFFDIPPEKIQVVIHPQSIVHAAVETTDGNIIMEASYPDMLLPVARSIFLAAQIPLPSDFSIQKFSPFGKSLSFHEVDKKRFPSIELAKKALVRGEKYTEKLLRKNDELVSQFLAESISFEDIFLGLEKVFYD